MGGSWLRALGEAEKLQRPLRFTAHGAGLALGAEGTIATSGSAASSAVCGGHEMRRGRHYATFTLRDRFAAILGVAGPSFDHTEALESNRGRRSRWVLSTANGNLYHANPTPCKLFLQESLDADDVVVCPFAPI